MMRITAGKVYLIGAGPGDPLLLTLKGAQAIASADVLVYDRLAHPKVLEHARRDAELVYVGKSPQRHTLKQEEINQLLVDKALEGKVVARVKGGDPFVFGRGGEEAEKLVEHSIPFEVVPGITSAISVPAYAGIPVTHRDYTSALGIITGHEDPTRETSSLNYEHLAKGLDTLVFLMGVGNLPEITTKLMEHGRSAETPVAVIEWGARPEQRVATGTLGTINEIVEREGIGSPSVVVVGEVVRLREKLRWFDTKPLFGRRIIVTRAREQASELSERLAELGASVLEFPVIVCRPIQDLQQLSALDKAIEDLPTYDWIVFTSVNGWTFFRDRLLELGLDVRALAGLKIAAMGEATREALEDTGLRVDFVPTKFVGESFAAEFPDAVPGRRIVLPRAQEGRDVIPSKLGSAGCTVDVVACYRTMPADTDSAEIRLVLAAEAVDAVTFTSSSTVKNFLNLVEQAPDFELPDSLKFVSIGPVTSQTAREAGLKVEAEAVEHSISGVVDAVLDLFSGQKQPG